MRALVLQDYGRLVVEDLPNPSPVADEVLIRVLATGICGSDVHGFTGENGRRIPGQIMGHESVGRVEELGPDVPGGVFRHGQTVTFNPVVIPEGDLTAYAGREQQSPNKYVIGVRPDIVSSFAELITVPARNVVPLPEDMPTAHGALVEPFAVAVHAVRRSGARPGQRAFVAGGGPIGQSIVLALQMADVDDVLVSEVDPRRCELIRRLGARAFDPRSRPAREAVLAELGGPAEVALDAVGIDATIADALEVSALGANVCLVGMGAPTVTMSAYRLSTDERTLIGSFSYSAQDFRDAAEWIGLRPRVAAELISREVQMGEANDAFAGLARADGTPGKVLVRLND